VGDVTGDQYVKSNKFTYCLHFGAKCVCEAPFGPRLPSPGLVSESDRANPVWHPIVICVMPLALAVSKSFRAS
jgi:hypothetical protein